MDPMVYKGLLAVTVYFERELASTFSLELWTRSFICRNLFESMAMYPFGNLE
jgi:hypothetical protein